VCKACRTAVGSIDRRSARIAYYGLFALSFLASWVLREVAALMKLARKLRKDGEKTASSWLELVPLRSNFRSAGTKTFTTILLPSREDLFSLAIFPSDRRRGSQV
jgi:hypothetical protein